MGCEWKEEGDLRMEFHAKCTIKEEEREIREQLKRIPYQKMLDAQQ